MLVDTSHSQVGTRQKFYLNLQAAIISMDMANNTVTSSPCVCMLLQFNLAGTTHM